ncbi:Pentatricopeptide repeat, partial [Arabidopsis thaliana x Arabidopsis arenosa]
MGSTLQQILRSLCSNTDWNYAVFWKLNHHSPMVLTLEDVYCVNHERGLMPKSLQGGCHAHDPLGLAVAKMSYHVHSLGEGTVGQVAISGQHQWIFSEYLNDSHSTLQVHNGWESQISAGIKTILIVAVGSCGVVQLGSLCKVEEDPALVTHIRHLFLALKDPLADHASNSMRCDINTPSDLPKIPSKCLHEAFPDFSGEFDKAMDMEGLNIVSQNTSNRSDDLPYNFTPTYFHMERTAQVIGGLEAVQPSMFGSNYCVTSGFSVDVVDAKHENQVGINDMSKVIYDDKTGGYQYSRESDPNFQQYSRNHLRNSAGSSALAMKTDRLKAGPSYPQLDSTVLTALITDKDYSLRNEVFQPSESQGSMYVKDTEHRQEKKSESSQLDALTASLSSFSGSELLEALGPAFSKTSTGYEELAKFESAAAIRRTNDMSHSHLTFDSSPENLLDAVVASMSNGDGNVRREISSSRSTKSLLTTAQMAEAEPFGHKKQSIVSTVDSVISQPPSAEGRIQQNPSNICGAFSSIGFSSTCLSSSSDQFPTSLEIPKKNKKRAKPGESSRPRPRDRQLIQDRIKELRELVPNGSKCSIDSLLECTIKHMLFLQNVSKHADKLTKSASSKMQHKDNGTLGSSSTSTEQGSSWAVEIGGHLQVCSIMVENLDKGVMLIEMLCEECSHFLEIANVIRSLELIILRGITEKQGEKTWICFVVEGQNNKVMHRMDILWSLVQIFQPKATINGLHLCRQYSNSYMNAFVNVRSLRVPSHHLLLLGDCSTSLSLNLPILKQIIKQCSTPKLLESALAAMIKTSQTQNCYLMNQFITACSSFNRLDLAVSFMNQMQKPNVFVYNALIKGFVTCSHPIRSLEFYVRMLRDSVSPSSYTYSSLVKASAFASGFGESLQAHIWKFGFGFHVQIQTTLIGFYSASGRIREARKVFDEMPERDDVTWTTMVSAYRQVLDMASANSLANQMPEKNEATWNCLIDGYTRLGNLELAESLFNQMPVKDIISWTTMINGYSRNKRYREAIAVFYKMMEERIIPDEVTMSTVISACAHLGVLEIGKEVHMYTVQNGFVLDVYIGSALVDMYSKCGSLERALLVFFNLPKKNLFCWNSIIEGLAAHGFAQEALKMFAKMEMESVKPNAVTFVSVFTACTHAGLVEEGRRIYRSMIDDYSIVSNVEHYGCMVHLFSKAGLIYEALELIGSMEFEPNAVIWGALLDGCRIHKNLEIAEIAFNKLMVLEPMNSGYYFLLVSMYAEQNRWRDVAEIRGRMRELGIEKICPGTSSIRIDKRDHLFAAADKSHSASDEVCLLLDEIYEQMGLAGYVQETDNV